MRRTSSRPGARPGGSTLSLGITCNHDQGSASARARQKGPTPSAFTVASAPRLGRGPKRRRRRKGLGGGPWTLLRTSRAESEKQSRTPQTRLNRLPVPPYPNTNRPLRAHSWAYLGPGFHAKPSKWTPRPRNRSPNPGENFPPSLTYHLRRTDQGTRKSTLRG